MVLKPINLVIHQSLRNNVFRDTRHRESDCAVKTLSILQCRVGNDAAILLPVRKPTIYSGNDRRSISGCFMSTRCAEAFEMIIQIVSVIQLSVKILISVLSVPLSGS